MSANMKSNTNISFTADEMQTVKDALMALVKLGRQEVVMFVAERAGGMIAKQQVSVVTDPSLGLSYDEVMDELQSRVIDGEFTVIHPQRAVVSTDGPGVMHEQIADESQRMHDSADDHGVAGISMDPKTPANVTSSRDPAASVRAPQNDQLQIPERKTAFQIVQEAMATGQAEPMLTVPPPRKRKRK